MQRVILLIIAVLLLLPVIVESRWNWMKSVPAAFSVTSPSRAMVRIRGDVRHPGIYEVNANALTGSVINMATTGRVLKQLLPVEAGSRTLVNGSDLQIKIQHDGTGTITVGAIPSRERMVLGIPLDINSMKEAEFDRLPGVGPALARRIIKYRQKNGGTMKVEELVAVEGIGEKKYNKISKYF